MVQNDQQKNDSETLTDVVIEKYNKIKKSDLILEIISKDKQLKDLTEKEEKNEVELEKMKENEKSYKEQLIRMQADFENYKKREEKKKQEFMEYSKQDLICQLLSVIDNLERASTYTEKQGGEKHIEDIKEGLSGILKNLQNILEKEGLKPIKAIGEKFDPYCHEAIMNVESKHYPEDTVAEELVKGYYLKSKVLRPSVVKVSKGFSEKQGEKDSPLANDLNNDSSDKKDKTEK